MKLGVFLLVLGAVIAAMGTAVWVMFGGLLGHGPTQQESVLLHIYSSLGLGGIVLGGALFIAGIIRIISKK